MNKSTLLVIAPFVKGAKTENSYWANIEKLVRNSKNIRIKFILKTSDKQILQEVEKLRIQYPQKIESQFAFFDEYLWDTLVQIETTATEWILQIHQDDTWSGYIDFPTNLKDYDVVFFNFFADDEFKPANFGHLSILPGRIAFSAIPPAIWKIARFTARELSWKVSPSFDSVLALLSIGYGDLIQKNDFSYNYNITNWKSGMSRRRHLKSLMKYDVWRYAPVEMSVVNRDLDLTCSKNLISGLKGRLAPLDFEEKLYGVGLSRSLLLSMKLFTLKVFLYFGLIFTIRPSKRKEARLRIAYLTFTSIVINLCHDRDKLIEYLKNSLYNPSLSMARSRISFWIKYI